MGWLDKGEEVEEEGVVASGDSEVMEEAEVGEEQLWAQQIILSLDQL